MGVGKRQRKKRSRGAKERGERRSEQAREKRIVRGKERRAAREARTKQEAEPATGSVRTDSRLDDESTSCSVDWGEDGAADARSGSESDGDAGGRDPREKTWRYMASVAQLAPSRLVSSFRA